MESSLTMCFPITTASGSVVLTKSSLNAPFVRCHSLRPMTRSTSSSPLVLLPTLTTSLRSKGSWGLTQGLSSQNRLRYLTLSQRPTLSLWSISNLLQQLLRSGSLKRSIRLSWRHFRSRLRAQGKNFLKQINRRLTGREKPKSLRKRRTSCLAS